MSKQTILRHLDENWQELLRAVSDLSEQQLMEPKVCGSWSVRDIMNHITSWEEEATANIPLILDGSPTPRYSASGGIEAFNARAQTEKKDYTLSRIKREFHSTHKKLLSFLTDLPDSAFVNNPRLAKVIRLDCYEHYSEHAAQIKNWRSQGNGA